MIDKRFYSYLGPYSLSTLAKACDIALAPEHADIVIHNVMLLDEAEGGDIACYHNAKYIDALKNTKASACLIHPKCAHHAPEGLILLLTEHPYRAYAHLLGLFYASRAQFNTIDPTATIDSTAQIAANCRIGAYAVIEENVILGKNCIVEAFAHLKAGVTVGPHCVIGSHVSITHALIGDRVVIKPGARIGQTGFGFDMDEKGHLTVPQVGLVRIEDDVEVGANTTIDRGSLKDTIIGKGTRIDNQVQIAHNVEIGPLSVIVAQVGIAGSTKLGKFVIAAGQVGIAGHLTIGDGVRIAAKSGIIRDISSGETVAGIPAVPVREWHKQTIFLQQGGKNKRKDL